MKRATKFVLGLGVVVGVLLALFLLPVIPISVQYACFGNASMCSELSYSTFASVTYSSFHVGAVYVGDNNDGRFSSYCWMEGNPVGEPYINNGPMCGSYGAVNAYDQRRVLRRVSGVVVQSANHPPRNATQNHPLTQQLP
jgi:hypothetical protein